MKPLRLALKNSFRQRFRSSLTIFGIALALSSFCFIQAMLNSWYIGVRQASKNRLIIRSRASLVVPLPVAHRARIVNTNGVEIVGYGNWFGGKYRTERVGFPQFAIDENYLRAYPEYVIDPQELTNFRRDRQGALVGQDLIDRFGLHVGDRIRIDGTIYPGAWDFTIRGVYRGRDAARVTRQMFLHWDYLNERVRAAGVRQPDKVGFFAVQVAEGYDPAQVAAAIDAQFANSSAETLTESETAFQQSFLSMSSSIITLLNLVSILVLVIILLVLMNALFMTARERTREYAILKAVGFDRSALTKVVLGESLTLALSGFALNTVFLLLLFVVFGKQILGPLKDFFPVFELNLENVLLSLIAALIVGTLAAIPPLRTVLAVRVSEALRSV